MIDLSLLEPYGRVAVYCTSEEEAKMFMSAMWEQHPEKVKGFWSKGGTNWSINPGEIYYVPRIFHKVGADEADHCQSSTESWVKSHDYVVFPFSWFMKSIDLGDITVESEHLEDLLGLRC